MTSTENWILISDKIKTKRDYSYACELAIIILDSLIRTGGIDTGECITFIKKIPSNLRNCVHSCAVILIRNTAEGLNIQLDSK